MGGTVSSNRETLNGYVDGLKGSVSNLCGVVTASTTGQQDCAPSEKMREVMGKISELLCKEKTALDTDASNLIKIADVLEETDGNIAGGVDG